MAFDVILKGGTVVNHDGAGERDVAILDGRIAAIGHFEDAETIVDCRNLHVLPGVIDSHVHMREPGAEQKEDLETGSQAAILGGVTSVFEMPNTSPATVTEEALVAKIKRATHRMYCDFAFYVGATQSNWRELAILEHLPGCAGIKVFMGSSTGDLLVDDDEGVLRVLKNITRRASFHSEDEMRLLSRKSERVQGNPASHPVWRDAEAARLCTERLLRLARRTGKRVHVLHISTAEELPLLAERRDVATVEATPHHLTFSSDDYERLGNLIQMNPPIRDARHRDALWSAIASGLVDTVGSDHAPHTLEDKAKSYPSSPSGMPGVQTLVPVMLEHVSKGRLTIERFVDLTSHGPQRVYGISRKGRIAEGYDADITIVDLKQERRIENNWIASRCGWTPYHGMIVTGWPKGTMVRGQLVMWEDEIIGKAEGRPVEFVETLFTRPRGTE